MNQLIGESVTYNPGTEYAAIVTQRFVYDPQTGQMQLTFDGAGNLTDRYLWAPVLDQILADEKVEGIPYMSNVEWLATNQQHSVTDEVQGLSYGGSLDDGGIFAGAGDGTSYGGALLGHTSYNSWGQVTGGGYGTIFGYEGQYTDPNTGLQYHSQPFTGIPGRWYDPTAQVWLSQDPIFPLSGPNPYEYCGNSPTNFIDPGGEWGYKYNIEVFYRTPESEYDTREYATSAQGLIRLLTSQSGSMIDKLIIKGEGGGDRVLDADNNSMIAVTGNRILVVTKEGNQDITDLLRSRTDKNSNITLRACKTADLADQVAKALNNRAVVTGTYGGPTDIWFPYIGDSTWGIPWSGSVIDFMGWGNYSYPQEPPPPPEPLPEWPGRWKYWGYGE